jgi:hypothetical protein
MNAPGSRINAFSIAFLPAAIGSHDNSVLASSAAAAAAAVYFINNNTTDHTTTINPQQKHTITTVRAHEPLVVTLFFCFFSPWAGLPVGFAPAAAAPPFS